MSVRYLNGDENTPALRLDASDNTQKSLDAEGQLTSTHQRRSLMLILRAFATVNGSVCSRSQSVDFRRRTALSCETIVLHCHLTSFCRRAPSRRHCKLQLWWPAYTVCKNTMYILSHCYSAVVEGAALMMIMMRIIIIMMMMLKCCCCWDLYALATTLIFV